MKLIYNRWFRLLFSALTGVLVYAFLMYSESGEIVLQEAQLSVWLGSAICGQLVFGAVYRMGQWLDSRIPWNGKVFLRLLCSLLLDLLLTVVIVLAIVLCFWLVAGHKLELTDYVRMQNEAALKLLVISIVILFIYEIITLVVYSYEQFAETQLETASLKRKQLALQSEMLRAQLSPHYVFNSLNTISSLIEKDSQQAEEFIRRLAQTYQYILNTHTENLVSLSEELEFVKAYNYLLRIRFNDAIKLEIDLPQEILSSKVPPFSIQMLVENAVKHNVANEAQKLHISMQLAENGGLIVRNNKTQKRNETPSLQFGLENIRQRYAFFSDKNVQVNEHDYFEVIIPLIRYEFEN
jgi:two-component system, LytTR family, sensor kinase